MTKPRQKKVKVRDLTVAYEACGTGPLVIFCHGFPDLGRSWRYQLPVLAEAGYQAVAPDLRGYGATEGPCEPSDCTIKNLIEDLRGLVGALGQTQATLVGHDFGAMLAWHAAALYPETFTRVACISVPYPSFVVRDQSPLESLAKQAGDDTHYMLYFQEPGTAEAELEADVDDTLRRIFWSCSGKAKNVSPFGAKMDPSGGFLGTTEAAPDHLPAWLEEEDLEHYRAAFEARGFSGPLSWYRGLDEGWKQLNGRASARVLQPAVFFTGDRDALYESTAQNRSRMRDYVPSLHQTHVFKGCGHWVHQERVSETNRGLLEFLSATN